MLNKKNVTHLIILLVLVFTSCRTEKRTISRCWFFTHKINSISEKENSLNAASFLCLNEDSSYTRDFGLFDFGRWEYKDHLLVLTSKRGQTQTLPILSLDPNEMDIDLENGDTANFDGEVLHSMKASEDPFVFENNLWRIPAIEKESDVTLRARLANHCQFWAAYFTWALKSNQQTVDVRSTPTCIKIYGNGFALKPLTEEPSRWKSFFHDEDDCQQAFMILKAIFDHNDIAWAHTDNKYKMFIGAFQQLQSLLK